MVGALKKGCGFCYGFIETSIKFGGIVAGGTLSEEELRLLGLSPDDDNATPAVIVTGLDDLGPSVSIGPRLSITLPLNVVLTSGFAYCCAISFINSEVLNVSSELDLCLGEFDVPGECAVAVSLPYSHTSADFLGQSSSILVLSIAFCSRSLAVFVASVMLSTPGRCLSMTAFAIFGLLSTCDLRTLPPPP